MMKRWGMENGLDIVVFLSLISLVAITPLGSEATYPVIFGIYRTLLILIIVASTIRIGQYDLPQVSFLFLGLAAVVVLAMYGSAVLLPGSHFEGVYTFYQKALFLAAFISLASFHRTRPIQWKNALLALVVVIEIAHVIAAGVRWDRAAGPLMGPFVNPNYFASYLLVGFAICTAGALFSKTLSTRLAAVAAGLFLFYGIVQTSSRGAFLSVLALLGVAVFRTAKQYRIAWWRIAIVGILLVVIAAAANPTLVRKFSDRGELDPYNYERVQIWMKSLSMIAAHPVLGVGIGRFYYVSKLFTPAVDGTIGRYQKWANIAHSEYLQYMAELGIPIAFLIFAIGGYLYRLAWKRAESVGPESRVFQEAALLAAAGIGTHALVDNNWTVPVVAAGLAAISLADILPYRPWPFVFQWTPVRKAAAGILIIAVFVQAVKVPALGLYFNEAGHRAYNAGDFHRAEALHRLGLGFAPDHPVMLDNLGMVYFDMFRKSRKNEYLNRAESMFNDSLAANPSSDRTAGHMENLLFERLTGDVSKDQPIHSQIVSIERLRIQSTPYNPFVRKNLAEALFNLGQKQQAIEELQKAVELEPNYVPAYLQLGQWAESDGRANEAEQYRSKANAIVMHYKDHATNTTDDTYDALMLGRPAPASGKP